MWRRAGAATVVLVALAVGVLAFASTAAPATFEAVTPSAGAQLSVAPQDVSVQFAGHFEPAEYHMSVVSANGTAVGCGPVVLSTQMIKTAVQISTPGTYRVAYHVLLADGRELAGESAFTVANGRSGPCEAAAPQADHVHGDDPLSVVLTLIAVGSIFALAVIVLRRPRLRQ